jgi:hypothetical protein
VQLENIPRLKGKRLKQTVVGHDVHDADEYDPRINAKFSKGSCEGIRQISGRLRCGQLENLFDANKTDSMA